MRQVVRLAIGQETKEMPVREFKGQRVVTFQDIDRLHQRAEGTAESSFNANQSRFMEGTDYFLVKSADVLKCEIRTLEIPHRGLTLITESGYLRLVKSLTDDLAWEVQRQLVNNYFRAKSISSIPFSFAIAEREIRAAASIYRMAGKSKSEAFRLAVLQVQKQTGTDLSEFLSAEPTEWDRALGVLMELGLIEH